MGKQLVFTVLLFSWTLLIVGQNFSDWSQPSEGHPIVIQGIKNFKDPVWVSVGPHMYKQRGIDIVIEKNDIDDCPHTIQGWKIFQLSPMCYNHVYVSDMVRLLVYEMVDSSLKERIECARGYIPPYVEEGIPYRNLLYRKMPCKDFLIVYMTVNDYLDWAPKWHVDFCCKSPYNRTSKNTLFYRNDRKRHGLFLKFAIPLAPLPTHE